MMNFDGILMDIDNTIYDYESTHKKAFESILNYTEKNLGIKKHILTNAYSQAREEVHLELKGTAASHNRLLYFQRMFENLKLNPMKYSLKLNEIYWKNFIDNIVLHNNVLEFLNLIKNRKVCLLTDLTADVQHAKSLKLKLYKYAEFIVTSEETGMEKPHPYMFMLALKKMNMDAKNVCMIGDDFKKDIIGATNLGIKAFWLNTKNEKKELNNLTIEVNNFKKLIGYFNE